MGMTAAVIGASGYAGGELLRLLNTHPELEVGALAAGSNAGRPLAELHPGLRSLHDRVLCAPDDPAVAAADVVFLALPHGESAGVVAALPEQAVVIDLGADFRLEDPSAWERYYAGGHAGTWIYGLPELPGRRADISAARRVANPGCYATAITLALAPLLAAGVVAGDDIVVVAASGTSGAGRAPKPHLLGSEVMNDLSPYKVGGAHQHLAEIKQSLASAAGGAVRMSFTPVLAPMPRGILATCTAPLCDGATTASLSDALHQAYDDEAFVHVLADGQWPHTAATTGSNGCHLQVVADIDAGRAVVVAALDNLGKGAAGQAIQNANLVLGLPEALGLAVDGVAP